jgi:hypothetical protein
MSESPVPTQDTKRRLAPQVSFKPDPSYENGKRNSSDAPRKVVIRFTREVLIAKRKPSSLMACMANLPDIVSENPADPVCFETLEPEDVIRIWNAAKIGHDGARGRGRSRLNRGDDEDGNARGSDGKDLWDAEDSSTFDGKPFDFSKVAEESEKFRFELDNMKKSKHALNEDAQRAEEIDMDSLIDSTSAEVKKPVQETPAEVSKVVKIEFGSLLSGNSSVAVVASPAIVSNANRNSSAVQQGFDAPFDATAPATSNSSGSSLLSKIGVKLEPDRPIEWFYRDPSNMIQGPFCQANMRQWNKGGYFTPELPIQLAGWNKFHAFVEVFPDKNTAFEHVPSEPLTFLPILNAVPTFSTPVVESTSESKTASVVKSEPVSKPAPQPPAPTHQPAQSQPLAQPQTQAKADVDRSNIAKKLLGPAPQPPAPTHQPDQSQPLAQPHTQAKTDVGRSNIAKKLLGISSTGQTNAGPAVEEKLRKFDQNKESRRNNDQNQSAKPSHQHAQQAAVDNSNSQTIVDSEAGQSNKLSKGWNKLSGVDSRNTPSGAANLLAIQEEQRVFTQQPAATTNAADSHSAAPTGAASLQLKSFLGINASKALGMNNTPKGWSNSSAQPAANNAKSLQDIMSEELSQKQEVVTSGGAAQVMVRQQQASSHSWASKVERPSNAPPTVVPTVLSRNSTSVSNKSSVPPPAPVVSIPTMTAKPSARNNSSNNSDFGGKVMSAEMSDWCNGQLKKLNVAKDLSGVLDFCMSLKSSAEIREILSTYLGSSAQVTNFATDFIHFKEDGKRPSSELSGNASDPKRSTSQSSGTNFQQKKRVGK